MTTINPELENIIKNEPVFEVFAPSGLFCCVQRMMYLGNLNGYVAVGKEHPFYGKSYADKIQVDEELKFNNNYFGLLATAFGEDYKQNIYSLDMVINVHCGLTYSNHELRGIENGLFGDLWWFGFDTNHAGDASPFIIHLPEMEKPLTNFGEYRDFKFVKNETKKLAEQLSKFNPQK